MENNYHNEVLAENVSTTEKKVCKCCGNELPLSSFKRQSRGYRSICLSCERKSKGINDRFAGFTDRDLMEELRSRGYKGKFKRIRIEEVSI